MTHNLDPVQWDNDRAQEVLYGGKEGILLLDKKGGTWSKTKIAGSDTATAGVGELRLGKSANGKFIATIEPMHGTNVAIYTPGNGEGTWKRELIDSSIADGHAVATGDLLQAGNDQVVIGWRGKNADGKVGIKLFQKKGEKWESSWVDDNGMACEDLKVVDLNGDSRLDIVASGRATKNVKIYWNQGPQ